MSSLGIFDPEGQLHTDVSFFDEATIDNLDDYATIQYYQVYMSEDVTEEQEIQS